jgi:hypothetical protein
MLRFGADGLVKEMRHPGAPGDMKWLDFFLQF